MSAPALAARRVAVRVGGVVQGVGFRPFVFRLAERLELSGFVLNDSRGVLIEAEGDPAAIDRFLRALATEAPPLARVERAEVSELEAAGASSGFEIVASAAAGEPSALVSADCAPCAACLRELHDPADRRHRYPFANCTDCGPRFTIVQGVPYDRPLTTMAGFTMCPACQAEYDDPREPPLPRPAERVPGVRSARDPDRGAGRAPTRSPRRRRCCATARSWRSRASAATTWRAGLTTRRRSRRCAGASTARTSRSR